jgi:hypothetical protein
MITICEIAPETLEWTGQVDAIEDGAEVPAGWVAAEPPELAEGQVATWSGEAWWITGPPPEEPPSLIHRIDVGTSIYTGESVEIAAAAPCPKGWVRAEAPPAVEPGQAVYWLGGEWLVADAPAPSIEPARAAKRAQVDAVYEQKNTANFAWDFGSIEALDDLETSVGPAGIRSLQIRGIEDKTNWTAIHTAATAAVLAGNPGALVPIKCDDNVWVQTTALDVLTVLTVGQAGHMALLTRQSANLARYGALKKLVADAVTQADLDAIDLAAGWPE